MLYVDRRRRKNGSIRGNVSGRPPLKIGKAPIMQASSLVPSRWAAMPPPLRSAPRLSPSCLHSFRNPLHLRDDHLFLGLIFLVCQGLQWYRLSHCFLGEALGEIVSKAESESLGVG
jgi:hypothetical protein